MAIKVQYYRGIKFIKYDNQNYYCLPNDSSILLHRFVWLCEKGEIPKGYDVHHIDHNTDNNTISNLTLLTRREHIKLHFEEMPAEKQEVIKNNMRKARFSEKCVEYHLSDAGRKQKSETAKKLWAEGRMTKPNTYVCEVCGKEYSRRAKPAEHRFCSWKCRVIFENPEQELVCPICGKTFIRPAGKIGVTCSKSCGVKLNHRNRNN